MKSVRCSLITGVVALVLTQSSSAQFGIRPAGVGGFGVGGGVIGFTKFGRRSAFSFSIRRSYGYGIGGLYGGPPAFAPAYGLRRQTQIFVYNPPVVVQPAIDPLLQQALIDRALFEQFNPVVVPRVQPQPPPPAAVQPPPPPPPLPPANPPLQGNPAGKFRPLEPDNRERALQPIQQPKPKEQKPVRPQPPVFNNEKDRLVHLGREAFAQGLYGLAAERFRRAVDEGPDNGLPHLLLAQAYFALRKYRLAHDELIMGLERRPDWPKSDFRPAQLYGNNVANYAQHLLELENLLADRPKDALLRFIHGYLLWHEGRRAEAQAIFEMLIPTFPKRKILDLYLAALPNAPII